MLTETWPIDRLTPYDRNPRQNDGAVDAVARSLAEFGFRQPIVVDSAGVIIVGHTRWKAAKSLGMTEVPVHVADLSPDRARAYRIADNQTATIAEWDRPLLADEIAELRLTDLDIELLGFSDADLAILGGAEIPAINKPIDEGAMADTSHECPKCGFKW